MCACRQANSFAATSNRNHDAVYGWLGDQTELDGDLADTGHIKDTKAGTDAGGTNGDCTAATEQPRSVLRRMNSRRRSWVQFSRVEVWLARHGVLFSFCALMYAIISWMVIYGFQLESIDYPDKDTMFLAVAIPIGRACGVVTNFTLALVILFMARLPLTILGNSPLNVVFPFGSVFELHKYFAVFTLIVGTIHGVLQTVNFAVNPVRSQTWDALSATNPRVIFGGTSTFVTGWLVLCIFIAMAATFYWPVKSIFGYQGFLKVHWLWVPFLVLMLLHGNEKGNPVFWMYFIGPGILLFYHYFLLATGNRRTRSLVVIDKCNVDQDAQVLRLEVLRGSFSFRPGQYAFLGIKNLGTEVHPFTIASSPNEDSVTFYIKVAGDWTRKLYNLIHERKNSPGGLPIEATLSGPYGAPTEFAFQFENIVLVGTGVGATPFIALLRDVIWFNKVKAFLSEESYKLSEDPLSAKQYVEEAKSLMSQLVSHKRFGKKAKNSGAARWKWPNSYTYGVVWILYLTLFLLVFRVRSVQATLRALRHGRVILYLWYTLGSILVILYTTDIAYRFAMETYTMPKRQILEITLHSVFALMTVGTLLCEGIIGGVNQTTGTALEVLGFLSIIGWFLYINRISGMRAAKKNRALVKETKAIKLLYVDRSFGKAEWITKELQVLESLAKELESQVAISFDMYFTRDKLPPTVATYAHSDIITIHTGRPNWQTSLEGVVKEWNTNIAVNNKSIVKEGVTAPEELVSKQDVKSAGMFFCGSPIVANTLRKSANLVSMTSNWKFVWHQESFG